jgi:hypothetical protein
MKKIIFTIGLGFLLLGLTNSSFAATTQVDALIEKLVEKGILDRKEAISLKGEIVEDEKLRAEENIQQILPKWVMDTKLKGDFRVRYQSEKKKTDNSNKERGRMRMRLGIESKVNDSTKAYVGLATGSSTDNRSTNQTFDDSFEKKSIWLDYAYVEHMASPWATVMAGRMKNPMWQTGDALWDTDINPEGGAITLTKAVKPKVFDLFLTTAYLILEDSEDVTADSTMLAIQPGFSWTMNDKTKFKLAGTLYQSNSVEGHSALDHTKSTNTISGGGLKYDYDPWVISSEVSFSDPIVIEKHIPYLAFFEDYFENPDPKDENIGWIAGVKLGKKKVSNWGDWQFKCQRRRIGRDAWLDTFPDSDAYGGATNIQGNEYLLTLGLNKNMTMEFDYYDTDTIKGAHVKERLFQTDLNVKF